MKRREDIIEIDALEHVGQIMNGIKTGVLLTTAFNHQVNTMTISWGHLGFEWNRLIFIAYVRTGRHTHKMLEQSNEFTINVGSGEKIKHILSYCGTKSGADTDKIKDLGLTLVPGIKIVTPGIKELPITLECKVIYKQVQDKNAFSKDLLDRFYPAHVPTTYPGSNHDFHTMYFGEVVGSYIAVD